jgi:hypothetical protein
LSGGRVCDNPEDVVSIITTALPAINFDNTLFEPAEKKQYLEKIISFVQARAVT